MGINMRAETEMLDLILQTAETIQVKAVAMSGSRTNSKALKDEFQDYDVVYLVENFEELISDLSWLDRFGKRIIEQEVGFGHRRLFLMLFEDGNRIDLTLCLKEYIQEWVDSEAGFTVLEDPENLFEPYFPNPERYWITPATETDFEKACNEFWWVSAYVVKGICRNQVIYATDHLYGICQQELLQILAWQVASDRGKLISKNFVILLFCKCFIFFESLLSILNHLLNHFFIVVKTHLLSKGLSLLVEEFHRSKQRLSDFIYT